jgi:cytochrome c oxidase subunit 4
MMSHHASTAEHDLEHSHGSFAIYMAVFGGLVALTCVSYWLGNSSIKDTMPASAWAGMMAVSCGKAMLVILFFMHLKWEANWKYVLTVPAMMMSVFLVCMLIPDVGMRLRRYSEERIIHAAQMNSQENHARSADHGGDHVADDGPIQ